MAPLPAVLGRVRSSLSLSVALERAGLLTLADRLDAVRDEGDLVAIPLPVGPGQLRAHRVKMRHHRGRDLGIDAYVEHGWHGFERPLPDVLLRTVRHAGGVVVDVGANSGFYALVAAEARNDVVVHAFEPFPPVTEILRDNLARNRRGTKVHVHTQAAADLDGEMSLYIPRDCGLIETSASLDPDFKGDDVADEIKIETITLDRFWAESGRPRITVLKIDTEGTEHRVLAGAATLVAATRPTIFCEVLPRASSDAIDAFCTEQRYTRVRLTPHAAVVAAAVEFDPDAWNHCFVPDEQYAEYAATVLAPILPVVDTRSADAATAPR